MTLRLTMTPAESGRYATSLVFLPGLWLSGALWRRVATFLGHRGWQGEIAELGELPTDVAGRADAIAAHVAKLAAPPVLIGHDAGALVALRAAARTPVAAVVAVAPAIPGQRALGGFLWRLPAAMALLLGRPVPAPDPDAAAAVYGPLPGALHAQLRADAGDVLLDVVRDRLGPFGPPAVPTLVVSGDADPTLPAVAAADFAARLHADVERVPGAGHWLVADDRWQATAGVIHRWLVRRLGESLLEYYAEAMAERDAEADDD